MRKIKYISNNEGVFVSDNYKKRVSDTTTFSCLVALDSNLGVLRPYIKKNSIFVKATEELDDLKGKSNLYYNIKELTYLVDCSLVKKGDVLTSKPININILQVCGEDLVLHDVTIKIPYQLRELLESRCISYLKLRMS